jgi:TPR repeat protein
MSETLVPPGTPRNRHRRSRAPGANEPLHPIPGSPVPPAIVEPRSKHAANGAAAEDAETRWRDVEWVGFGDGSADEPAPASAQPVIEPAAPPQPIATATRPDPPPVAARQVAAIEPAAPGPVLRFAQPGSGLPVPTRLAIHGLPPRFIRLAVPRSPPSRRNLAPLPTAATEMPVEAVVLAAEAELPPQPVMQEPPSAAVAIVTKPEPLDEWSAVPLAEPEPGEIPAAVEPVPAEAAAPRRARRYKENELFFPASFYTPISAVAAQPDPAPSPIERITAWLTGVGARLRRKPAVEVVAEPSAEPHVPEPLEPVSLPQALEATPAEEPEPIAAAPREPVITLAEPEPKEAPALHEHMTALAKADAPVLGTVEPREPFAALREFPELVSPDRTSSNFIERLQPLRRRANRLAGSRPRLSFLAIVAGAIVIAVIAYQAGGMLAGLAGARPAIKPPPAKQTAAPATAVPQPPSSGPPAAPAPASPPAALVPATPPSEPAARAAFYLARAKTGDAAAQFDIGVLYARGDGVVQDYGEAATWFRAAAAQGNVAAAYNLGVLYERGLGVPASTIQALNWYRSAADRNHPAAQYNLALALAEGRGTEQDIAGAARWYRRAAEQGVVSAMVNLAILYERGEGVDRSVPDAYGWYAAAADRGDTPAKQHVGELYKQFSADDKKRADGIAASIAALIHAPTPPPPPA